ncbi:unnamed protein product [Paramecium sonneborni]|uniref:Uncharacterized protein n=1 Tax=Paramecium sonneborni TaxID=65129 RepID=A0A8S1QBS6_9CILI|nr:unnamed protein product [Paramecium sonneborni]
MQILNYIHDLLHKQFIINYITLQLIVVQNKILQSTDNNQRNFSAQKITDILLQSLTNLLERIYPIQKRSEMIDIFDLDIAFKCFSSIFQKENFKDQKNIRIIQKNQMYNKYGMQEQLNKQQMILEWLNEKKIFKYYMLIQNSLNFLFKEKIIWIPNLKEIQDSLEKAEYEHKLAIYKLFKDFSNCLEKEWLEYLTDEICNRDLKQVSKDELDLLLDIAKSNHRFKEDYWNVLKMDILIKHYLNFILAQNIEQVLYLYYGNYQFVNFRVVKKKIQFLNGLVHYQIKMESFNCLKLYFLQLNMQVLDLMLYGKQYQNQLAIEYFHSFKTNIEKLQNKLQEKKNQIKNYLDSEINEVGNFKSQMLYLKEKNYQFKFNMKLVNKEDLQYNIININIQQKQMIIYIFNPIKEGYKSQSVGFLPLFLFFCLKIFSKSSTNLIFYPHNYLFLLTLLSPIPISYQLLRTKAEWLNQWPFHIIIICFPFLLFKAPNNLREYSLISIKPIKRLHQFIVLQHHSFQHSNKLLIEVFGIAQESLEYISNFWFQFIIQFLNLYNDNQTIVELRFAISNVIKLEWDAIGLNCLKGDIKFTENGKMKKG